MAAKNDPLRSWLDLQTKDNEEFKQMVEIRLAELRLAAKLQPLRQDRKLSQAQLSRVARISQSYLARLEAGGVINPELRSLVRIATALGLRLKLEFEDPNDKPKK